MLNAVFNGLSYWFCLAPIGKERTSSTLNVLTPRDGSNTLYDYHHGAKKEGLAGVPAMPLKMIASKRMRLAYK